MELAQAPRWAWAAFGVLVAVLMAVDLVLHRGSRLRSRAAAITWSGIWVGVGLAFTLFVWAALDGQRAGEYITAYLIEKSLSVDNLFVFLVIFRSLGIPHDNQRSILSWGIFGALVFRLAFILLGVAAMERYHWIVYVFGVVLLWGAVHVFKDDPAKKTESKLARWLWLKLPVTQALRGNAFFVSDGGRRMATPLFVALCAVELTDIAIAIDSVPAALAVSTSTFVVYSSNVLALLGLRSLYLVLDEAIGKLRHLHYGLAAVLAFAGTKLVLSRWVEIPSILSIGIIVLCIGVAIWTSFRVRRREARGGRTTDAGVTSARPRHNDGPPAPLSPPA
jgi:tellurite resistance protein TerC